MEKLEIEEIFKNYYLGKIDIETVIYELRFNKLSQMQSTLILIDNLKISLKEADSFIVNSKAWSDKFENLIKLRENFFEQAKLLTNTSNSESTECDVNDNN